MSEVGERLKAARKRKGWTQEEVARRSGVLKREEVVSIETGRNQLSSARVQNALAQAFGVPIARVGAYLVDGTIDVDDFLRPPVPLQMREPLARYGTRAAAIRGHVARGVAEDVARDAADEVAVALKADVDPDEFWWFEQIAARLRLRQPFANPLGERVIEGAETAATGSSSVRRSPSRQRRA